MNTYTPSETFVLRQGSRYGRQPAQARIRPTFGEFLADVMDAQGIKTVKEFADRLSISRDTFYGWTRSSRKPDLDNLRKISELAQTPLHELVYMVEPDAIGSQVTDRSLPVVQIPVQVIGHIGLNQKAQALLDRWVYVEEDFARGRELVAYWVLDASMEGGKMSIQYGDIVIVNTLDKSLHGEAVVAALTDGSVVCKRPILGADGKLQQLGSVNLDYKDPNLTVVTTDRIDHIIGRVVRTIHDAD